MGEDPTERGLARVAIDPHRWLCKLLMERREGNLHIRDQLGVKGVEMVWLIWALIDVWVWMAVGYRRERIWHEVPFDGRGEYRAVPRSSRHRPGRVASDFHVLRKALRGGPVEGS
jgi:hypothetical protein